MMRYVFVIVLLTVLSAIQTFGQTDREHSHTAQEPDSTANPHVVSWKMDTYFDSIRVQIDTAFYTQHQFNPNLGNISLGSYGTPLLKNKFQERESSEFLFHSPYTEYLHDNETTAYYRTNKPFTYFNFDTGGNKDAESDLKILHTQNVNQNLNFGIDANIISSKKFYERETSLKSHHITFFTSYEDTLYQLHANLITNKITHDEIGGIDDVQAIQTTGFLENASTTNKSKQINLNHQYFFIHHQKKTQPSPNLTDSLMDVDTLHKPKRTPIDQEEHSNKNSFGYQRNGFGISHQFGYHSYRHKYVDEEVSSDFYQYYPVFIDSSKTKDQARQQNLSNRMSLFYDSPQFSLNLGLEHNYTKYSYIFPYDSEDTIINKYDLSDITYHNIQFTGNIQVSLNDDFTFRGALNSWFFGYHRGDLSLNFDIQKKFSNATLQLDGKFSRQEPDFFFDQYNSNYLRWNNTFDKISTLRANLGYQNKQYDLNVEFTTIFKKDHVYFNTNAKPVQYGKWWPYFALSVDKTFHFWKFQLHNEVQYQFVENENIIYLPAFYVHQTLALKHSFHFDLTGGKLDTQLGVGYFYFTRFHANAYMPALGMFHRQEQQEIGDRPLVNVFANIKLARTSFYFKAFHANSYLHADSYYSAPDYPVSGLMLKFGILWSFYD